MDPSLLHPRPWGSAQTRAGQILPGAWVPTLHPGRDASLSRTSCYPWAAADLLADGQVQTSAPSLQQRLGLSPTWMEVQVVMMLVSYMVLLSLTSSGKTGLFSVFGGVVTGGEGFLGERFTSVPLPKAWMAFPGGGGGGRRCLGGLHPGQGEQGDGEVPYGDRGFP